MFSPGFGPLVTPEPDVVVAGPEVGEPENENTPIYFICTQINEMHKLKCKSKLMQWMIWNELLGEMMQQMGSMFN